MFRQLMLVAAVVTAGISCRSVIPPDANEAVRSAILALDSAWNRKDTVAVSRLLAPTYVYFSSRGGVTPREQVLAMLLQPHYQLDYADRSELAIHLFENSAVVESHWRGRGSWEGQGFVDDQRCSLMLGRGTEGWLVLSEHCTQITG